MTNWQLQTLSLNEFPGLEKLYKQVHVHWVRTSSIFWKGTSHSNTCSCEIMWMGASPVKISTWNRGMFSRKDTCEYLPEFPISAANFDEGSWSLALLNKPLVSMYQYFIFGLHRSKDLSGLFVFDIFNGYLRKFTDQKKIFQEGGGYDGYLNFTEGEGADLIPPDPTPLDPCTERW